MVQRIRFLRLIKASIGICSKMWSAGLILFLVSMRCVYIIEKKNNVLLLQLLFSCHKHFLENLES